MEYEDITQKIIGCVYRVYNTMGFGYLESVYERCLTIELNKIGLAVMVQKPIPVFYDEQQVGDFVADMVVEDKVIVELKSVKALLTVHEVQLVNYLVATGLPVGLLANFGETGVKVRRKVRVLAGRNSERVAIPKHQPSCNPVGIFREVDMPGRDLCASASLKTVSLGSNQ